MGKSNVSRVRTATAFVSAAALAAGLTVFSATATAHWDQEAVTTIAQQLPAATEKLYEALLSQPPPGFGGGDGDGDNEFSDNVRLMHSESMHLASELKKGKSQAQTKHAFQRIKELNDDAKEYAREQFMEAPVTSHFSAVEKLIEQLAHFY